MQFHADHQKPLLCRIASKVLFHYVSMVLYGVSLIRYNFYFTEQAYTNLPAGQVGNMPGQRGGRFCTLGIKRRTLKTKKGSIGNKAAIQNKADVLPAEKTSKMPVNGKMASPYYNIDWSKIGTKRNERESNKERVKRNIYLPLYQS